VADDHVAGEIGNKASGEPGVALHVQVVGRRRSAESRQGGCDEADRCVADCRFGEKVVVESRGGECAGEQEDCVTGALRPDVAQHPAGMLPTRLDHAAARVDTTQTLSPVMGDAKSVDDRFIVAPAPSSSAIQVTGNLTPDGWLKSHVARRIRGVIREAPETCRRCPGQVGGFEDLSIHIYRCRSGSLTPDHPVRGAGNGLSTR
jgi:hypothetical protein